MKLHSRKRPSRIVPSRKRPEQSKYTLALAVSYSFFLHAAIVAVALFLHFLVIPKTVLPPSYQVKLVGQPKETVPIPAAAPVPPKKEAMPDTAKPSPKTKKAAVELKKAARKKDSIPDLTLKKKTPAPMEQTKSSEATPKKSPAIPSAPAEGPATAGKKSEGVDVTPRQDFKYSWYIDTVSEKIRQNWNPPPDSINAKARVIFKINRSGWLVAVRLDDDYSNGSFTFKQAAYRAIQASNPFPRLPDEFFQQSLEFTVDLIPED
ncbi:MAG: cell envelope integrity protein TolA [Nitrospirae bacterium]|nr:cell envelope integrity protein TolA [Nitrospirota bacterium]